MEVVRITLGRFMPGSKGPDYPLNAKLGGPRICNERFTEKVNLLRPFRIQHKIPRTYNTLPTDSTDSFVLFISHSSNHYYLTRNQQQAFFFSLFAKAIHQS